MAEFDWNDLRAFLAVVRTGRLVAAAHQLGIDHSTLSRRIGGLEKALQTRLFDRKPTGYTLTATGENLVRQAEAIESLTIEISSQLAPSALALAGSVRIATPEGFGTYFLAAHLRALVQAYPEMEIELVAVPGAVSFSKREADLAVTISPPEKGRLRTRRLVDYELGLYAARAYVADRAPIRTKADCRAHALIGYVDDLMPTALHDYLNEALPEPRTHIRISNIITQLAATRSGAGICILPCYIAHAHPDLVRLLPREVRIFRSYWLVVHAETRAPARCRALTDFLCRLSKQNRRLFLPDEPDAGLSD